jgi:predicted negative regulator of RcsB-dependent stress response
VDELLTDEQQAEKVKSWISQNGGAVLAGLALGLGGLFGWNWWQDYQIERAEQASATYEQLVEAVRTQRTVRAAELELELAAEFSGSPYVDQARLALAKLHMDRSEADEAERYLQQVADGSGGFLDTISGIFSSTPQDSLATVARLRLARVQLHREQYAAALTSLDDVNEGSAFAPRYHEARGDIYAAMGEIDQARLEYETALNSVEPGVIDRGFVQVKLDNLAATTNGSAEAATVDDEAVSMDAIEAAADPSAGDDSAAASE